ncbi:hypothetical protein GI582_25170 [Sulfitobacter sp. BDSS02]|nr:hypothetical protein [Sulfitobacter sp. BDSS02]MBR9852595.1 hypothetical protein [Paracoccaceae bacterium]
MVESTETHKKPSGTFSAGKYRERLQAFDAAVCEAVAVSQACAGRFEAPAVGYSTHVFGRICAHAQAMMCAAPKSRWVSREFDIWDVSSVASHARSILEGYLLFRYLADAPDDLDTQRAYVQVMHLYDCMKRIKILPHVLSDEDIDGFQKQAADIKASLEGISYFANLDQKLKKELLAGKWLTITPQKEIISDLGINQSEFDFFWNYLSQYTHVLSFTFYRIESNGRGTGLENDFDRDALCMVLEFCNVLLVTAVDRLIEIFPDAAEARHGLESKFAPGPIKNLPKEIKRERKKRRWR